MKTLLAMAIPILPGKTQQFRKFTAELSTTYHNEFSASRKKLKVRERAFLQMTPKGDYVIVTLEGDDPKNAFKKFGQGNDPFIKWFVKEVREIHGIDLLHLPEGPLPELVIDSQLSSVLHN
jgi:hypothetical protein